jgi:hypothetical protein
MKRIYLIFLIFIAAHFSFSQNVETADGVIFSNQEMPQNLIDKKMSIQEFLAIENTETETMKILLEQQKEEQKIKYKKYNRAKYALRTGIIMIGVGFPLAISFLNVGFVYDEPLFYFISGAYGSVVLTGISIAAVGAYKKGKYKLSLSASPSEVKFSINF